MEAPLGLVDPPTIGVVAAAIVVVPGVPRAVSVILARTGVCAVTLFDGLGVG